MARSGAVVSCWSVATLECLEKIAGNSPQSAIKAIREFLKQESDAELKKRAESVMEKI